MEPFNRIEAEMKVWRNREERFEKLFPGTLQNNRAFLAEKLNYLHRTQIKFGKAGSDDERLALKILRLERKQLERQLYPGFINRTLRNLLRTMILVRDNNRQQQRTVSHTKAIISEVGKIGLGAIAKILQQKMDQGIKSFSIPHSQYINGKESMDFKIDVAGNTTDGYKLAGIQALLKQDGKTEMPKCQFNAEQSASFNINQAYNLLKGRSVQTEFTDAVDKSEVIWKQLDFNDRDSAGNYKIMEYPAIIGYNLEKELNKLPLVNHKQLALKDEILKGLKNGDLVEVKLRYEGKGQQFFLEANPRKNGLGLYNAEMRKISPAIFDTKQSKVQTNEIKLTKVKKLDIIPPKQLRRSRSRGIN